jgi:hypothetical protein
MQNSIAREPIMVDTGQYTPILRPRPYSDVENQIANDLAKLERFTARVKLLSGTEHLIRANPPPQGVSAAELAARLREVKDRMLAWGCCRDAREVEKEVAEGHAQLQRRGPEEPPPTRTRVRRTS